MDGFDIPKGMEEITPPKTPNPTILQKVNEMKTIQQIKKMGIQKGHGLFMSLINQLVDEKQDHKGKILDDGMTITGIGKQCIKVENFEETRFVSWEIIENIILYDDEETDDTAIQSIINYLFEDSPYQNQIQQEEEYENLGNYIYSHIIEGDLTVDDIRGIIYKKYYHEVGEEGCEEKITECLLYAFKYTDKVKVTNDPITSDEDNEYAFKKDAHSYFIAQYDEIICNETEAHLSSDENITFTADKEGKIHINRRGEEILVTKPRKDFYISDGHKHGKIYVLTRNQQIQILSDFDVLQEVTDEEVINDLQEAIEEHNPIGREVKQILDIHYNGQTLHQVYFSSPAVKSLAKYLYKEHRVPEVLFLSCLQAVEVEQYIPEQKIVDYLVWGDGYNTGKASLLEDKYDFTDKQGKQVLDQLTEYTYTQNPSYTKISQVYSSIDTFEVTDVYLKGDISEEEAIRCIKYIEGMEIMKDSLKHMKIYTDGNNLIKY